MVRVRQQQPAKAVLHKSVDKLLETFTTQYLKGFHRSEVPHHMHIATQTTSFWVRIVVVSEEW